MEKGAQILVGVLIVLIVVIGVSLVVFPNQTTTGKAVTSTTTKQIVKIGFIAPMSGSLAFIGVGAQNAVKLAQSEINPTKYNYELYYEDDQLNPKMTSTAANKLISINNVHALISLSSGSGNVVTPIANQYKKVHMAIGSDANMAKGIYNFVHWTSPESEAKAWAAEAKKRGIKKVALMEVNQQGEIAIANALKKELKNQGIGVVFEALFNFGDKDFKTMLLKSKEKNPDIYMLAAFSPEVELLAKQAKELGIKAPLSSIESFEATEQKKLFEGEWYVNVADPTKPFETNYKSKYGKDYALAGPNAYDNYKLLVRAYETAGDGKTIPSSEKVALAMLNIQDYSGSLGPLTIGPDGIVNSNAVVRMIKNGKPVTISS